MYELLSTRLHQLVDAMLDEQSPTLLQAAADELFTSLATCAGLDKATHSDNTQLPAGTAIAPYWAASCMQDLVRTQRFMQGVHQAVLDAMHSRPGQKTHLLYVGTGPFAALVLPVLTRFSSEEVAVTLLDVHESSLSLLEKVIAVLGVQDRVKTLVHADAATYLIPECEEVHIVVVETMQHALEREPQLAITLNLVPQLAPDTIWIPQNIRIEAALIHIQEDHKQSATQGDIDRRILGPVLNLNRQTAGQMAAQRVGNPLSWEAHPIDIPLEQAEALPWLALLTEIHIYGKYYLQARDSALCAPRLLTKLNDLSVFPKSVCFSYSMAAPPGFHYCFR
jgi:hypothetical protein